MPEFLEKKIAGIPAYIWGILVIGAIGLGLFLRKRSASSSPYPDTIPSDDTVPLPGSAGSGAGGGGSVGGGGSSDNSAILDAISQLGTDITGAIASIPIPSEFPAPAMAPAPPSQLGAVPSQEPAGASALPAAAPPASVGSPAPPRPGPVAGASFSWSFNSIAYHGQNLPAKSQWFAMDKGLFLQHLAARGLSYANWKANHAAAALRVFGDA